MTNSDKSSFILILRTNDIATYNFDYLACKVELKDIRSSEKFLSLYKEIIDTQHFPFYIILSNYVRSILLYQDKDYDVRQSRVHVCIKICIVCIVKDASVKERHLSGEL